MFLLLFSFKLPSTWISQKFCNILVHASLQYIYHVTEAVQAVIGVEIIPLI